MNKEIKELIEDWQKREQEDFGIKKMKFAGPNMSHDEKQQLISKLKKVKEECLKKKRLIENDDRSEPLDLFNRMKAGIIGFTLGDALGVPVEFQTRRYLEKNKITDMIGYGTHKVPKGTWSDDTSMILATMDSILQKNYIDYEDIMKKFSEWMLNSKYTATNKLFDIGITTSNAINKYINGAKPIDCGETTINSNGNGSLMRILPIVYYIYTNDIDQNQQTKIINESSSLTHAHEISKLGCKIFSDYVLLLLNGIDKQEAYKQLVIEKYIKDYSKESIDKYKRILDGNLNEISIEEIESSGYIVSTLEASIWCVLTSNSYEEAVIKAVNLGNDTDTIGAITGALSGIIYGTKSLPNRWINKIESYGYLNQKTNDYINMMLSKNSKIQHKMK